MLRQFRNHDLGLFVLRLVLAAVFIGHGWQKLGNMEGTVAVFQSAFHLPAMIAYLTAGVEFLGGFALLVGIGTDVASLLLAIDMVSAIYIAKLPKGFLGGYEFELTLLAGLLCIFFTGAGRYTIREWKK